MQERKEVGLPVKAEAIYATITAYKGRMQSEQIKRWALRQGLEPTKYFPAAGEVQFTDGEIYTTCAVILDQAAYEIGARLTHKLTRRKLTK